MIDPEIDVTFTTSQDVETGAYCLDVNITRAEDIPSEILVLSVVKNTEILGQQLENVFKGIATITQLNELNQHTPNPGEVLFLENHAIIKFASASDMLDAKHRIGVDITELVNDYKELNGEINTSETITYSAGVTE